MKQRGTALIGLVLRSASAPPLLVAAVALVVCCGWLQDLSRTWQRAETLRQRASQLRMRTAAETVAMRAVRTTLIGACDEVAGVQVEVSRVRGDLLLRCRAGDGDAAVFACAELAGAGPTALSCVRAACAPAELERIGGGTRLAADEWPKLDGAAVAAAPRADAMRGFRADQAVALQFLRAGTDRDDHVWIGGRELRVAGGVLVVPGHLWVEPGREPLRLSLADDLTLVVEGNLYVGRSVEVAGPGRLLVVTTLPPASVAFADRDGSGGWSSGDVLRDAARFTGPVEGGGSAFFGLGAAPGATIRCGFGLVIAGELHAASAVAVDGPLVLRCGLTVAGDGGLEPPTGGWSFRAERERIPGFVTSGSVRPGLLRAVDEDTLYLSGSAR